MIPDNSASRQHAEVHVQPGYVTIKDLGSRNGILVNDRHTLNLETIEVGDRITIGGTELILSTKADKPSEAAVSSARQAARESSTGETSVEDVFGNLVKACEAALDENDTDRAAFATNNLMLSAQACAERGHRPQSSVFRVATEFALMLTDRTGDHDWLDRLFSLCTAHPTIFDPDMTERIVKGVVRPSTERIAEYLQAVNKLPIDEADVRNLERLQKLQGTR